MSIVRQAARVIEDALSMGGDPLDIARELAKHNLLNLDRVVDIQPSQAVINEAIRNGQLQIQRDHLFRNSGA